MHKDFLLREKLTRDIVANILPLILLLTLVDLQPSQKAEVYND